MTESEVRKRLAAGEDPLDLAIEKWVEIREGRGEDLGHSNCALCLAYERCDIGAPLKCIITIKTGETGCRKTPYDEWVDHHRDVHSFRFGACECKQCEKITDKQIAFLKSLKE